MPYIAAQKDCIKTKTGISLISKSFENLLDNSKHGSRIIVNTTGRDLRKYFLSKFTSFSKKQFVGSVGLNVDGSKWKYICLL